MNKPSSLSLYVHAPWCLVKCPYCDFNAYAVKPDSDKNGYIAALISDFKRSMRLFAQNTERPPASIYFGGGTPSLFSPDIWAPFFKELHSFWPGLKSSSCEITMEISPLVSSSFLEDFINLGINRFSAGIQSFQPKTLQLLGREHRAEHSHHIASLVSKWEGVRWNLDLMYGLAQQSPEEVQADLKAALSSGVTHLSWYELMIEPNTAFARTPEIKASEEQLEVFERIGHDLLSSFEHYEVSAYAQHGHYSRHNMAYWMYDDYLGLGAGAHSKISFKPRHERRFFKTRSPKDYIRSQRFIEDKSAERLTDFLISRLRLFKPLHKKELSFLSPQEQALLLEWLQSQKKSILWLDHPAQDLFELSPQGHAFLSDVLQNWMFYKEEALASKKH